MMLNACIVSMSWYQTSSRLASFPFILQTFTNARIVVELLFVLMCGSAGSVTYTYDCTWP